MWIRDILSIVAGGVITILVTVGVEALRRPKLRLVRGETRDANYEGRPAKRARYLYVDLVNEPLPWFARWMARSAALQCTGTITFHHLDGQQFFSRRMPVRFSRSPEPVPIQFVIGGTTGAILDPARMNLDSRIDLYPGERTPLDVAARFDGEDDAYGWSNENYFSAPPWRNPNWRLPKDRYLVAISISSSGQKCETVFRLLNDAGPADFRLEPAQAADKLSPSENAP